ncbi:MAG TPA: hypothetical protein VH475_27085, partial [Tepidisphaeraceae bacterium]
MIRQFIYLTLLVTATGATAGPTIQTLAGTGRPGFAGDAGPAKEAQLNQPFGLSLGPDRALYFCDTNNQCIRRIATDGTITTIAGTPTRKGYTGDNGPALKATLNVPYELRFDQSGDLFVVERMNHCVRKIDMKTGTISTLAGNGKPGYAGDGGPASAAQFNQPHAIQFDPAGDLYVCDILNHRVRRIDMKTLTISTWAGTGEKKPTPDGAPLAGTPLFGPRAIDFDKQGNAYLALREGNAIYRIDAATRTIHHLAGSGQKGFTPDPVAALMAGLNGPKGVALGPDGQIYLADTEAHAIRMIDPKTGTLSLLAGTGKKGDVETNVPAQCSLNRPHGIYVAPDGTIYI